MLWLFCNRGSNEKPYPLGLQEYIPYDQRKGVSPAPCICPTSRHWIFVAKILGIFQCDDLIEEISKLPTNKDLAFVTVPFSLVLRWHLRRHFCETLHVLQAAINKLAVTILLGKKASKYKSEGNFLHIKKLLMACEILAWWASHNDKNSEISLYALISNATYSASWIVNKRLPFLGINILKISFQYSTYTAKETPFLSEIMRYNDLEQTNTLFLRENRNQNASNFANAIKELKQTTTTTATRTSPNKRFNEQNNSCARAL